MKYFTSVVFAVIIFIPFGIAHADVATDVEPTFDAGSQIQIFKDDFDGYTTFADTVLNGWQCTNGQTVQDTGTNPLGACQILPVGYDGTGKAIKLVFDGKSSPGGTQEGHSWNRNVGDPLAGEPGHDFYISYYFRLDTPGFVLDTDRSIYIKWLELWNDVDRAQFSTGYQHCGRVNAPTGIDYPMDGSGMFWQFYGNGGGNTDCQASQIRPPYAKNGTGAWHRVTYKYETQSGTGGPEPYTGVGNHDGIAQMWYDGTLIVSVAKEYCGVVVPDGVPVGTIKPPHWCEAEDLAAMFINSNVTRLSFGNVSFTNPDPTKPYSIDFDHMSMWRDNGSTPVPPITPPANPAPPAIPPPSDNGGTILTSPIVTPSTPDTTASVTPPPVDPLAAVIALILDNRPLFEKATSLGITLPPLIQKVLDTGSLTQADLDGTTSVQLTTPTKTTTAVTSTQTSHTNLSLSSITRPLKLTYIGTDVILLQNFLIQTNAGPQAKLLATHGANGSFGPLTQAALMEYQKSVGIPGTGILDSATKSRGR